MVCIYIYTIYIYIYIYIYYIIYKYIYIYIYIYTYIYIYIYIYIYTHTQVDQYSGDQTTILLVYLPKQGNSLVPYYWSNYPGRAIVWIPQSVKQMCPDSPNTRKPTPI